MVRNVGRQTGPQTLDPKALEQRLVDIVNFVRGAKDCEQLRRRLKDELYTDGEIDKVRTERWTKTVSGKHTITHETAVLALLEPVDERDASRLWRAYDLDERPLGLPDDHKYPLVRNTRKKIIGTPLGKALVKVVGLIKDAKDPKKLYEEVLKVIDKYPEAKKLFPQR
jgi:hypothetical protein